MTDRRIDDVLIFLPPASQSAGCALPLDHQPIIRPSAACVPIFNYIGLFPPIGAWYFEISVRIPNWETHSGPMRARHSVTPALPLHHTVENDGSVFDRDLRSDLQPELGERALGQTSTRSRLVAFSQPSLGQPESHNSRGGFSTNSLNEQCCRPIYAFISIQSPFYIPTTVRLLEY